MKGNERKGKGRKEKRKGYMKQGKKDYIRKEVRPAPLYLKGGGAPWYPF
jgi:hypothetical protein